MKKILDYLEELGFSKIEAQLYVSLLQLGPLTVQELARNAKINRTAAYGPINALINKGVVVELRRGSRKQFKAIDPDRLHYLIDNKLDSVRALDKRFPDIVTTINTSLIKNKNETQVKVKYYTGVIGARDVYVEAFQSKEVRSYVRVEEKPILAVDNPSLFNNAFKQNKSLKMWEIIYESPFSRRQALKILSDHNNYFYKFMPPELKWSLTSEDVLIYDNKVGIINYTGKITSVVLYSPDYYHNSKEIFDFIWRMLPEPNPLS